MMHAVPYQGSHLAALAVQPAQQWFLPLVVKPEALEAPHAYTLICDGLPIVCCGAVPLLWPSRAYAWSFLSERIDAPLFIRVQRWAKQFVRELPFHRVEAACDPDWENGHRWLRSLGFVLETPRAEGFEPDGRAAALYARVRA